MDNQDPVSTISYASYGALIDDAAIYTTTGERVNNLTRGKTYRYRYRVKFERSASYVRFGMLIKTISGVELGGGASASSNRTSLPFVEAGSSYIVEFDFCCRLNPGVYFLNAGVTGLLGEQELFLHRVMDACLFRVLPVTGATATGVVDFSCRASCVFIEP